MQETVKQDRDKYIGGSDIPVIMNLSPFKSRFDLLLEKAGYKESDFEGNVYTEYGNKLEPKIREYINNELGLKKDPFVEGKHTREAEADEIIGVRIHTDGENDDGILEIKTKIKLFINKILYFVIHSVFHFSVGNFFSFSHSGIIRTHFFEKSIVIILEKIIIYITDTFFETISDV